MGLDSGFKKMEEHFDSNFSVKIAYRMTAVHTTVSFITDIENNGNKKLTKDGVGRGRLHDDSFSCWFQTFQAKFITQKT